MSPHPRPPCAGLWNTPMIHTDGTVTTCCLDEHLLNALGNIRSHSLAELWYGERMHRWRLAQIRGDFHESGPFCMDCNWQSAGSYPPEKVTAYLAWYAGRSTPPRTELDKSTFGTGQRRPGE